MALTLPPLNLAFTAPANATSGQNLQGAAWGLNSPFTVNVPGATAAAGLGLPTWALLALAAGGVWLLLRRR